MSRKGGMPEKRRRDPARRFEAQQREREEKRRRREAERGEAGEGAPLNRDEGRPGAAGGARRPPVER